MISTLLLAHSYLRFGVLAAVLAGLCATLLGWWSQRSPAQWDRILAIVFLGLYDLQALIGVILLAQGAVKSHLHATVMLLGVILAHILFRSVRSAPVEKSWLPRFLFYALPLACIIAGLVAIGHFPI